MHTVNFKFSLRVPALMVALFFAAAAQAGFITLDQYTRNQANGGVNMKAHYNLGDDWDTDCCDPNNIRWIQMITLTNATGGPKTDIPGYPHSTFIDPEPTQGGQTFDSLPWYDFTYLTSTSNTALNGSGPYIRDFPGGWGPFGKMGFSAVTLAVCIDSAAKTMQMLGGFNWGFDVSATGVIAIKTATAVAMDSRRSDFNTALYQTFAFADWNMETSDMDCQLTFLVPGPASITCITFGMAVIARRRRAA